MLGIIAIVIGILALVLGLIIFVLSMAQKKQQDLSNDFSYIASLFTKDNVRGISFIRNKIVVDFINVDFFDPQLLQEAGAKGISIVGDRIKFYVEGTPQDNQTLYLQIKQSLEG